MKQSGQMMVIGCGMVGGLAGVMVANSKGAKIGGIIGLFLVGVIIGGAAGYGLTKAVPQ